MDPDGDGSNAFASHRKLDAGRAEIVVGLRLAAALACRLRVPGSRLPTKQAAAYGFIGVGVLLQV